LASSLRVLLLFPEGARAFLFRKEGFGFRIERYYLMEFRGAVSSKSPRRLYISSKVDMYDSYTEGILLLSEIYFIR